MKSKQWFIDRIGKRIYRDKGTCTCMHCQDVEASGLIVIDKTHAKYLYETQQDYASEGIKLNYKDNK